MSRKVEERNTWICMSPHFGRRRSSGAADEHARSQYRIIAPFSPLCRGEGFVSGAEEECPHEWGHGSLKGYATVESSRQRNEWIVVQMNTDNTKFLSAFTGVHRRLITAAPLFTSSVHSCG